MTPSEPTPPVPDDAELQPHTPLREAALEIDAHALEQGWDRPPALFALVPTADLLAQEPAMAEALGVGGALDPDALTPVLQDAGDPDATSVGSPPAQDDAAFEELLARIAWPEEVVGCAAVVERLMLGPDAEADLPDDPAAAAAYAESHPDRRDVRIVVAVTRSGEQHCVVRARLSGDDDAGEGTSSDDAVYEGPDLVPALAGLLRQTLAD